MIRRIALAAPFVCAAVLSLSAQAPPQGAATTVLPIRRVVLYKSGVGSFEHLGTVTGNQQLAVPFSGDQLDDVLKSLTAVDLGNGRVTGVRNDSPTPIDRQLEALQLPLGEGATAIQLLAAPRGSRVAVRAATGTVAVGRLLNAESRVSHQPGEPSVERDEISLVTDTGEIVTLPVTANTRIRVADPDRRQDLGRYLSITASNGARSPRRTVISTVGTGSRQFLVSYVGEAAVWKTTYRLIFPTGGRAPLLQGWAVVDNVSGADWSDVELSLVGGVRVTGVARDASGALLPGVTVALFDGGRQVAGATTDASGRYSISGVPDAAYTLQATLPGFTTMRGVGARAHPAGACDRGACQPVERQHGSASTPRRVAHQYQHVHAGIRQPQHR